MKKPGCLIGVFIVLILMSGISNSGKCQNINAIDPTIKEIISQISPEKIEHTVRTLVNFGTRHTLSDTLNLHSGIGAAQGWAFSELKTYSSKTGNRLIVMNDRFTVAADGDRVKRDHKVKNVIAILPGTDTSSHDLILVSGHLDSRASDVMNSIIDAPGANDDASGSALVIELARVLSGHFFPKTILFALVTGEEQGLYGAQHLAKRIESEKWNVIGMLNNDIVGNTLGLDNNLRDDKEVRVFSEPLPQNTDPATKIYRETGYENDGASRQLSRYIKEIGEKYVDNFGVNLVYRRDRYLRGGDHTAFSRLGFSAVRFTEMNENFNRQHQTIRKENGVDYGDLPDFVDYKYISKVASINAATIANLALAPSAPQFFTVDTKELTNFTTLNWKKTRNSSETGYYVLIRTTTSPVWEKRIFVKETSIKINYSKDNYLFGLQSTDSLGHTSIITCPLPAR